MFHRTRTRVVATVATLGLLGGAGFMALTPAAQADTCSGAVCIFGSLASRTGPTTVFPNSSLTKQPAGDWTTDPTANAVGASTNSESWSMFIMLDDIVPGQAAGLLGFPPAVPAKCKAASQAVGFATTPTVTNMTAGNTATFSARLRSSSLCTGISDILEIDSTHVGAAGAVLKISGMSYNVGSGVPAGKVPYKVNNLTEDGNPASFTTALEQRGGLRRRCGLDERGHPGAAHAGHPAERHPRPRHQGAAPRRHRGWRGVRLHGRPDPHRHHVRRRIAPERHRHRRRGEGLPGARHGRWHGHQVQLPGHRVDDPGTGRHDLHGHGPAAEGRWHHRRRQRRRDPRAVWHRRAVHPERAPRHGRLRVPHRRRQPLRHSCGDRRR